MSNSSPNISQNTPKIKQTALITGSAIRLGKVLAINLARLGYDIALHYNNSQDQAFRTVKEIQDLGVNCMAFQQDFSKSFNCHVYLETIEEKMPHSIGLLINNASFYEARDILQSDEILLDKLWQINFKVPYFLMQAFFKLHKNNKTNKHKAKQSQESISKYPHIINILDNKVEHNQYQYAPYSISKKALKEATLLAAMEFAPLLRVNAVSPGIVLPSEDRKSKYLNWRIQNVPLKKVGSPQNIFQAIQYLIENPFVTGQILTVDGGESQNFIGRNTENYRKL